MNLNRVRLKQIASDLFVNLLSWYPFETILDRGIVDSGELRASGEQDGSIWLYDSSERIEFDAPNCPHGMPQAIAEKVGWHEIEEPFVVELSDCQLVGPNGVTVAEDGKYILENSLRSESLLVRGLIRSLAAGVIPRRGRGSRDIETAVSMVGPWCRGYFHWFSEWLPRLEGVEHYRERTGRQPTLIVPPDPPTWMIDSLRLVGYEPDQWLELDSNRSIVDSLVIPSVRRAEPVRNGGGYTNSYRGYQWIRESILESSGVARRRTGNDRIYVSRSAARQRRVVNETEVERTLGKRGFESFRLEDLPFSEQVALFADAEAVVAPHGAGLVNSMFGDDLSIVELFGDYENACYFTLAQGMGFKYGCLKCESVGPDIRVATDRLVEVLNRVLD